MTAVAPTRTETELRRELAAVYRLVAHFGMTDLIFTHISLRLPGPEHHFLINPYGLLFEEITASALVTIDLDGQLVAPTGGSPRVSAAQLHAGRTGGQPEYNPVRGLPAGTPSEKLDPPIPPTNLRRGPLVRPAPYPVNPAGFVIHSAIHRARPDAVCVLHTHTKAGVAVAAQAGGLLPVSQHALEFYDRVGYHDYEGVALNHAEQRRLAADLGGHPALILRNHGLLTVGESAGQALLRMLNLERACQIQIAAQAGGELVVPPPDVCEHAARQLAGTADSDDLVDDGANDLAWAALLRLAHRIAPDHVS